MKTNSIYIRSFLLTASMVIFSFIILGTAFTLLGRSFIINERRENLSKTADSVVDVAMLYATYDGLDDLHLRVMLTQYTDAQGYHIFICDTTGLVVTCSDREFACPHIGSQISSQALTYLQANGEMDTLSDLGGFYEGTYYIVAKAIPSAVNNEVVGYVFVGSDSSSIIDVWETFLLIFFLTAGLVVAFAVATSFITSKKQARPINEMASAARRFARGEFSVRVTDYDRDDEIGALTKSFNVMADNLEKSEELRREFIANVSHELKTPMTTISGFADGLLDGTIPDENREKYLGIISSETKRLSRLVRSMLDLSRIQNNGNVTQLAGEFDLSELLRRTLINFEDKITEKGLDVDAQLPEEKMIVRGSVDDITQVVYNLLDNAIKFSHEGSAVGLSLWKQERKAYISVKNHGVTISENELPLIFDRFHKTDRSRSLDREGMGLGLYLVKTILNNHNEDIAVTSKDGVTEFVFTLTLKG